MSDLHKKLMLNSPILRNLPPRIPSSPSPSEHPGSAPGSAAGGRRTALKNKKDYSILPWSNYFDRIRYVETSAENKFRVYIKGDSGPVLFFLHGGGLSGLSWSLLSAILVKKIKCQCYSLDIRGHGMLNLYDLHFTLTTSSDCGLTNRQAIPIPAMTKTSQ